MRKYTILLLCLCFIKTGYPARYFDGTDDYMRITNDIKLQPRTGGWTVGMWVRFGYAETNGRLMENYTSTFWMVDTALDGVINGHSYIAPDFRGSGGDEYAFGECLPAINDGKWHYLVIIRDENGGAYLSGYSDGILAGRTARKTDSDINGTGDIIVGAHFSLGTGLFTEVVLSEITIWNKALTLNEAMSYSWNSITWIESNLVGSWKMDEQSGNCLDSSGNGFTMVNNGTSWIANYTTQEVPDND